MCLQELLDFQSNPIKEKALMNEISAANVVVAPVAFWIDETNGNLKGYGVLNSVVMRHFGIAYYD